jgi:hypothetical protein
MVSFQTKNWAYLGGPWNGKYCYIVWSFGIFYNHWVFLCALGNFVVICPLWYIVPKKAGEPGLDQEKSGSPGPQRLYLLERIRFKMLGRRKKGLLCR